MAEDNSSVCVLIPAETAGPFPLDLTANNFYFRQDIRENKTGVQLNLKMKIFGLDNCVPMENIRVNIWHCDKDGLYSGYNTEVGLTYLRGYQMTDAYGEANFITIFPGWYPGRVCHIHFQVYVSTSYSAVSQFTFDVNTKNAIYLANTGLYTQGVDPTSPANDNVFSDGYSLQLATLTPNINTGGYDSYFELSVDGTGTAGVGHLEKENAKQFTLGQNYPNPFLSTATIPFSLKRPSHVNISLWDLAGKKVAVIFNETLQAGNHQANVDLNKLNLKLANYMYQIEVYNVFGTFRVCRMMTMDK